MEEIKNTSSYNYKCPECGAPMHYDPESEKLKCDYCYKLVDIQKLTSNEEFSFDEKELINEEWKNENQLIRCKNCGAENVVNKKVLSITCPFCSSNQVITLDEVSGMKPNRVIPFHINHEDAKTSYINFIKKRFFVSNIVRKADFKINLNGVYMSSWTYDSKTYSTYVARLGKDYTVTVGTGDNKHTETRTKWFIVRGDINIDFDDVLVASGKSISQTELSKIEPYRTNESLVFSEEFLTGFSTEHYSLEMKEGFNQAKNIMKDKIRTAILSRYNYDRVDYVNINTGYKDITYKYVLLPIWIGLYQINNKKYRFLVNGESGKVIGKYPLSAWKISFTVILGLIILGLIIFLFFRFNN